MTDNAVRLTYPQYRAVRRLVHDCCNYDGGNCLLLDDGEECVCPQSISYSLICRWFRAAVLPLDESLCAALLHRRERKKCVLCGGWYIPKSNRAKYCPFSGYIVSTESLSGCAATGPPCNGLGP